MEAKGEMAARRRAVEIQTKRFEGSWSREVVGGGGIRYRYTLSIKRGSGEMWRIEGEEFPNELNVRDAKVVGPELRFKLDSIRRMDSRIQVTANFEVVATVTADGNTLRLAYTPLPLTPDQAAFWASPQGNYLSKPAPWAAEYRR